MVFFFLVKTDNFIHTWLTGFLFPLFFLNLLIVRNKLWPELKKKRTFRKFTFRGVDLDQLLDMNK